MASPLNPLPGRRLLRELLQEQQEPFLLEVHLLENGYSNKKRLKSQTTFKCWPKCHCLRMMMRRRRRIKGGILRCFLTKLGCWEMIRKALNWDGTTPKNAILSLFCCFSEMGSKTHAAGFHRLSLSGGELRWKDIEGSKQLSPVSVLELHSDEGSSVHNHSVEEENPSIFCRNSATQAHSSPLPQHREDKGELHPQRQLHFESVKEMEERIWGSNQCLGQKRSGVIIGEVGRITHLMDLDLSESKRGWSNFHGERREIGMEIEGAIFEEIREESVLDMLGFHCTLERC